MLQLKFIRDSGSSFSSDSGNEIANKEDWVSILVGDWNFKKMISTKKEITTIDGEITYRSDNTFERFATIKRHESSNLDARYLDIYLTDVAGGKIAGVWEINTGKGWQEEVKETAKDSTNLMKLHFPIGETVDYGTFSNDQIKTNITAFNEDSIKIEGTDFSTGALITIQMGKKNNNN